MRKWSIKFILSTAIIVFSFSLAYAGGGPANIYTVQLDKMELLNEEGIWITVFEGTSTAIDIASADAGSAAGTFLSSLSVPDGVYNQVRVTPSQTFTIKGNDGDGRFTNGSGSFGCAFTLVEGSETSCTLTVSTTINPVTTPFSNPVVVKDGVASHKIRVSFDTTNAIVFDSSPMELFPQVPRVSVDAIAL